MELAIVISLLFVVLFAAVQFAIAFNRYQGVHAAAREGARLGSLPQTTVDEIVDRVRNSISIIDGDDLSVGCPGALALNTGCISITPSGGGDFQPCNLRSGQTVKIDVKYRTRVQIPLWASPAVTVAGDGEFRCE